MPNFWPYYDVTQYASTPANYTYYLPSGAPMPHDDLVTYYAHNAKTGAYLYWPLAVAQDMRTNALTGQVPAFNSATGLNLAPKTNLSGLQGTHPFLVVDTTAPSAPTGLAVASKTSTSVSLTWNAVTDPSGIAGYNVYRGGALVGSPTSNSYTDTGLTAGTGYSYTVKARDTVGNLSAASSALSVTTSSTGATVTFNETASTVVGQNIHVVGNIAALGSWSTGSAIILSPANYPTWSVALSLPGSSGRAARTASTPLRPAVPRRSTTPGSRPPRGRPRYEAHVPRTGARHFRSIESSPSSLPSFQALGFGTPVHDG